MRQAEITRKTTETAIRVRLDLDGSGRHDNRTGIGFFDHMLDQLARHAMIDLEVEAEGDRHIDDHHSVEDVGIALGRALAQALGDKAGIRRYGSCLLPMDETLVRAALDLSGGRSSSGRSISRPRRSAPSTPSSCASSSPPSRCRAG
jgi:imidazoleglycerol-phosphate dehydratase